MGGTKRGFLAINALTLLLVGLVFPVQVFAAPPGFNVHLIQTAGSRRFWRGGAPLARTLEALAQSARDRRAAVTLIDLRQPANLDDQSGKEGRLSPQEEQRLARRLGLRYLSMSAMDKSLVERLREALLAGDVYIHCMYGVNSTGFATARYAYSEKLEPSVEGLGPRDWRQGWAFQALLGGR